jgi:hypothetical protein
VRTVVPERISTLDGTRYVYHLAKGPGTDSWQPIHCGGGIAMPYRTKVGADAVCVHCSAASSASSGTRHDAADTDRRADAELRDRLDALDDAQTEAALDMLLRNAPDLQRKALRELSLIDHDATVDALNETGA